MKKTNQKKQSNPSPSPSKELKLPLIQNNAPKGDKKEPQNKIQIKNTEIPEIPIPNIPLTRRSIPKIRKSFVTTNLSQSTNKIKKKKINNNIKDEIKLDNENDAEIKIPKISEEKLAQLKEQRKQRLKQQKKNEEKQIELYEKIIEEYKNNGKEKKTKKNGSSTKIDEEDPELIISSKKAQKILEEGGMLDAYRHVLAQLCKNGLPSGNIFEYASYVVKNYEKKWKAKKSKMMKDKIDKYYEEKQKEINKSLENDEEIKIVNKSLEHREELKYIQNLDKSRSGRNVIPKINNDPPKSDRSSYIENNYYIHFFNKKYREIKIINNEDEENSIKPIKLKESSVENKNKIMKNNIRNSNEIKPKINK